MQARKGTSSFESTPEEIQHHIFRFCGANDVQQLRQCSSTLFNSVNDLLGHEKNVLIRHYLEHYNLNIAPRFHAIILQPHRMIALGSWASEQPSHQQARRFYEGYNNYISHPYKKAHFYFHPCLKPPANWH